MGKLFDWISPNLIWLGLIVFCLGFSSGGIGAWWIQNVRIHEIQNKYQLFIKEVQEEGQKAQKLLEDKIVENNDNKQKADHEQQASSTYLHADIKRMQNARASSSFVPSSAPSTKNPSIACFDRAVLERTLQQFDDEIQSLITAGDDASVGLNSARLWAQKIN